MTTARKSSRPFATYEAMTPRIEPLPDDEASPTSLDLLQQVERALGMVPNLHRTLAHAPAALGGYVALTKALAGGRLSARLREQIAVATAGVNRCDYCAAAHTLLGKGAGVDADELLRNLDAESSDPNVAQILTFVRALISERGAVTDAQLRAVREAGLGDADLVELVAHVGMNWFTNAFNRLARTEVDFPALARRLEQHEENDRAAQ